MITLAWKGHAGLLLGFANKHKDKVEVDVGVCVMNGVDSQILEKSSDNVTKGLSKTKAN